MNVALREPMSLAEFLDWEDRQPLRHEFDGVRTIAMTGGTWAHAAIQGNLAVAFDRRQPSGLTRASLQWQRLMAWPLTFPVA